MNESRPPSSTAWVLPTSTPKHVGPVLGLGTAGAGLNVDKGVGGVHLAGEHAPELQRLDNALVGGEVRRHRLQGVGVILLPGHLEQFARLIQPGQQAPHLTDDRVQRRALAIQVLGALGVIPDIGLLELAGDFFEAFLLFSEVKDTPSGTRSVP